MFEHIGLKLANLFKLLYAIKRKKYIIIVLFLTTSGTIHEHLKTRLRIFPTQLLLEGIMILIEKFLFAD